MFDSVILIGPGTNLFPLINSSLNITNIPIINTELLLINLRFLQPISRKIYIIILQKNINHITQILNLIKVPVEVIGIDYYDGTVQQLLNLEKKLKSDNIIVTKGDLVTNIDVVTLGNEFKEKKYSFLTILSPGDTGAICGYSKDELIYYSRNDKYKIPNEIFINYRVTISKVHDTAHFFMFKKSLLEFATPEMFSFKTNFLPILVEKLRQCTPVKIYDPMDNYMFQVRDISSYITISKFLKIKTFTSNDNLIYSKGMFDVMKVYIKKNKLKDTKNIIGTDLFLESGFIVNSIIGNNVLIHSNTRILSSILMNNIIIGNNCVIEDCVVGSNVNIPDNTTLIKCKISPSFVFTNNVTAEGNTFSCN
ncbi:translation initiation factor 2B subunit gamma [Vairimorpha necatrix]|uniref:Translation initiation factor eIF2B subunit gamma n=1 Tax=Vairimorpha necatrix TaxID=6039 RepID=A0AAX4JA63_9MICR